MTPKKILSAALLTFVCFSLGYLFLHRETQSPVSPKASSATPPATSFVLEAYYFHGNARCYTCKTIEAYTKETIESNFTEELAHKKLFFQSINVEDPSNHHFIEEFQLTNPTVVLARKEQGQPLKFKNLTQVWSLVKNKDEFTHYIQEETRSMLGNPQ